MPNLHSFDTKLKALRNTEKMTRTMKLISMSKLYRAQENQRRAKTYSQRLTDLVLRLSASCGLEGQPLLTPRQPVKNILILLFTSDKGLCGSFNNHLLRQVHSWISEHQPQYEKISLNICGKRGYVLSRKRFDVHHYYEKVTAKPDYQTATQIGRELMDEFLTGHYDEIYLAYNTYHSPLLQTAKFDKILPIEGKAETEKECTNYLFEPAEPALLGFLLPKYLYFRVYFALLENSAGEHGARMTAMDSASRNAQKLIDEYTLRRNRARQAAITKELIEVVSGAEVLR